MVFLESQNRIIQEILTQKIGAKSSRPAEPMELRVCDFDDVQCSLSIVENKLEFSMSYRPYQELEKFGARQMLEEKYPLADIVPAKNSYDLTLEFNLASIAPNAASEIILELANMKRNLLGAPLSQCFVAMANGTSANLSPIQVKYRQNEALYIQPKEDRIVVVYSISFEDKTDQAIARVFLQEFAETGRQVNNAPPTSFSKDPPLELRTVSGLKASSDLVGYLSIAVFPSHVATDAKREKVITMMQGFRNYLHYHIKTSKSYLHSRMRKRVDMLLTVLNRAHPEKDPSQASKKTISGKTFSRA